MNTKYPHLFSPIKINSLMLPNRITANPIGHIFEDKSLGGAAVVIAGSVITEPGRSSWASPDEPYAFSKYEVEKMRQRILIAHRAGSKASIEISHAGLYARVKDFAKGPMDMVREDGTVVKAMDEAMMEETIGWYVRTARDAKDLGFDMFFMHFGHGWLASEFLSPLFNHRTDEYGGSIENRAKFPLRILKAIRQEVGPHFPIEMRVSAIEWVEGGIDFADTLAFVKMAEPYIDLVQISAGLDINHEGNVHMVTTNFEPHMTNVEYARIVKQNVSIPVSVVGGIETPAEAEEIIKSGAADMIALGRALLADPDWPKKARDGQDEDIVPCLRCLQCYHIATNRRNVGCSVNPRYAHESWIPRELEPTGKKKKVVIIGAGPAGIKAALTADQRGHEVILLEQNDHVGGQLHYIAMEKFKEDIKSYLHYLKVQLAKSGVTVKLSCKATPETVRAMEPDAIILAVGALPMTPPIPGIDRRTRSSCRTGEVCGADSKEAISGLGRMSTEGPCVMGFHQAIAEPETVGENVVIIGGGTIGAEIGLELSMLEHKNVTIVEMAGELAAQGNMLYKIALRQKMEQCTTLTTLLKTSCLSVDENGVKVRLEDGTEQVLPANTVIVSTGVRADRAQVESFYGIVPETYTVGDCEKPRKIQEATMEGYCVAANL